MNLPSQKCIRTLTANNRPVTRYHIDHISVESQSSTFCLPTEECEACLTLEYAHDTVLQTVMAVSHKIAMMNSKD